LFQAVGLHALPKKETATPLVVELAIVGIDRVLLAVLFEDWTLRLLF
jgi:hypothetical protein